MLLPVSGGPVLRVLHRKSYYEEEELEDRPRAHRVVLACGHDYFPEVAVGRWTVSPVNPPKTSEVAQRA